MTPEVETAGAETPLEPAGQPTSRAAPVLRTALSLFSVQGVTWVNSLVGILIVPRFLGSQQLGWFASAWTLINLLTLLVAMGTGRHIVREVARDPSSATRLVANALVGRLLACSALLTLAVVGLAIARPGATATVVVISMLIGMTTGLVLDVFNSALQGNQTLGRSALTSGVLSLLGQFAIVGVLISGGRIAAITAAGAVISLVVLAAVTRIFLQRFPGRWTIDRKSLVEVMRAGSPFLAWDAALLCYASIDMLLLPILTDAGTTGEYAFALRLAGIPIFLTTVITSAVFPELSNAALRDREWFKRLLTKAMVLTFAGTVPMSVGMALLSPTLASVIGGGHEFGRAVPLIVILSINLPIVALDTVTGVAIFALNRQKPLVVAAVILAVLNPLANLAAIPIAVRLWGNGAIGAALITLATELFIGSVILHIGRDYLALRQIANGAARTLVAAGGMTAAVVLTLLTAGPIAGVLVGVVSYSVLALVVGIVPLSEIRKARALLRPHNAGDQQSLLVPGVGNGR